MTSTEVHYMLKRDDGMYVRLNIDHMKKTTWPGTDRVINWRTASGSPVNVFGKRSADGSIDVDAMLPPEGVAQASSALVTTGAKRVLALRIQFDGGPTLGTEQDVRNTLDAAAKHFDGSSFGKMQLQYDVAGPFNIQFNQCDDYDRWMNEAKTAAQNSGFDLSQYQHFMIFGKIDCGYGGLGAQPGDVTWIAGQWPEVVVHELGHNFGLWHASSQVCKDSGGQPVTMGASCTFDEYGDPFDPMGHGGGRHYNANYKVNLGWIPSSQVVTADGDATYTLAPMTEPSSGTQLVSVKGPNDVMYHVEFRQPAPTNSASADEPSVNGVIVHAFFTQAEDSGRARLLDMTPDGNFDDAPLGVGKSYNFFGTNTTLEVVSVSPAGAQIKISGAGGGGNGGGGGDGDKGQLLIAAHSNKCMGVSGASLDNGAAVVQWPCNGSSDQSWTLQNVSGSTFLVKDVNSGKCLDVTGGSQEDGADVIQWDCHGGANQQWDLVDDGNGNVSLRSVNSSKCLDVYGASTADGARFIQWSCHFGANQQFRKQ